MGSALSRVQFWAVGVCLVSGSDEQEMKFSSFSCRNLAVLLLVVVHLESWSRREDNLGQLGIGHGFLSGLFYTSWVCRLRQSGPSGVPPTAIGSSDG